MADPFFESQELQDWKRGVRFLESHLEGEQRIETEQAPECEITIIAPVSGETPERIFAFLESIAAQNLEPSKYEVILVVNNNPDNPDEDEIFEQNQEVLNLPIWKNREAKTRVQGNAVFEKLRKLNLFAIDKSSARQTFSVNTIARDRNRGIAEASSRFFERQKDGLLLQTDADARLSNPDYLRETIDLFKDPDIVAAAGGIEYEFSPDEKVAPEQVEKEWKDLVLLKACKGLAQFDPKEEKVDSETDMSGANMMSRSFETAIVGGMSEWREAPNGDMLEVVAGEDTDFGRKMKAFAQERGKKVAGVKNKLKVRTALRESGRSLVGQKIFWGIDKKTGQKLIENPKRPSFGWVKRTNAAYRDFSFKNARARYVDEFPPVPLYNAYRELYEEVMQTEKGREFIRRQHEQAKTKYIPPQGGSDFAFLDPTSWK